MDSARCRQVGPVSSELVFVNFHPALVAGRQIYEGGGRGPEQDEVDADRVDQVEDVDHAVALLDEEHHVAQDEQDEAYSAELGPVDKPADRGHGEDGDQQEAEQQPDEPPAQHHQGKRDGREVNQVEVHRLAVVAVGQPPHRPDLSVVIHMW